MEKKNVKKLLPLVLLLVSLIVIAAIAAALDKIVDKGDLSETSHLGATDIQSQLQTIYINGEPYTQRQGVTTLLVIGVDVDGPVQASHSYNNAEKSDFLALVVFDDKSSSYSVLHINRDTMAAIPILDIYGQNTGSTTFAQLALAHTYGDGLVASCRNTTEAVSDFLYGVDIDNFICVTMGAVPVINDYVGGVEVTVEDDMTAIDSAFVKGETITLKGEQALKFVRARGGLEDSTNLSRMERQKQFITGLVRAIGESRVDDAFVLGAYDAIAEYTVTSCTTTLISSLGRKLESYTYAGAVSPDGATVVNQYVEFYVDEDSLRSIIVELFYDPVEE